MPGETRARIMDEALRQFAERGFAGTTISSLERGVGLAEGTGSFHRHFPSKRAVLDAVVERELTRLREIRPERERDPGRPLAERLAGDLEFLREVRPLIEILIRERATMPHLVRRVQEVLVDGGLTGIAGDLETGSDDPAAAATVLLCATVGYFLTAEFFGDMPGGVDPERYTRVLAELLSRDRR
ncbi:TetR/AcrR family transcriptional regulator [Amycolatopsis magusensis]|uniref:TetR/AcrR family transcriptional regulator n=1 Tax=Amycolatopsis magusensis TaxID=882444 RepID=UPI0037B34A63